ncbi:MAG TPA: type II toxin-antitoxin system RelE/ParE family toxin [Verrucomicrobiae bacterium]|nr:type II toxin-antitoxin system RelE/ParE family toxin [Verrucomicrobiae bacterium]
MKLKRVEYHPGARLEILEAFEWYEWHEPGLGVRFQAALAESENFIRRNPQLGTLGRFGVRKRPLKIFPYNLIYSEEPDAILVIALAHFSRHPRYWHRRLHN